MFGTDCLVEQLFGCFVPINTNDPIASGHTHQYTKPVQRWRFLRSLWPRIEATSRPCRLLRTRRHAGTLPWPSNTGACHLNLTSLLLPAPGRDQMVPGARRWLSSGPSLFWLSDALFVLVDPGCESLELIGAGFLLERSK